MKLINVTPHPINFRYEDGEEFECPPSGVVLNARFMDELVERWCDLVDLVRIRIEADPASLEALVRLEDKHPDALIVGSLIAAQAFPGRVVAMIAAPGYERRPPAEKRMRPDKFTIF